VIDFCYAINSNSNIFEGIDINCYLSDKRKIKILASRVNSLSRKLKQAELKAQELERILPKIKLLNNENAKLRKLLGKPKQQESKKAKIIKMLEDGLSVSHITKCLKCSPTLVYKYKKALNEEG